MPVLASSFDIVRSRPHGHVAAVLATMQRLALETVLSPEPCRRRSAVAALIAARILEPGSKLATSRALREETCHSRRTPLPAGQVRLLAR
jgi:hypothetical protein